MLGRGGLELHRCPEPLTNETVRPVPPEDHSSALADDVANRTDTPSGPGIEAYREETGWPRVP